MLSTLRTLLLPLALFAAAAPVAAGAIGSRGKKVEPEAVKFETEDDLTIHASYYPPRSKKNRAPAAILVHEAGGDRTQLFLYAERLNAAGLAVLVPDLRGHGDTRTDDVDWGKLDEDAKQKTWAYAPRDLEAGAAWLKKQREVHTANLTMVGLRSGAALAAHHAAGDDSVRAVVLIEPTTEQLGFDLRAEVASLAGLETKVFTPRDKQAEAEVIQSNATEANNGLEFIEIAATRSRGEELLHDRKVASSVAGWVEDLVFPKKGRR